MKRYEKIFTKFYNRIAKPDQPAERLEDIPCEALEAMSYIKHNELAAQFIVEELQAGKTPKQVSITLKIARGTIRGIGRKYGVLPRNRAKTSQQTI